MVEDPFEAATCPQLSPHVHTHASLPQHILNSFHSSLPSFFFPRVCLRVCFTLLCCSFPHSSPCFDMAGRWNFQPHNPRHQKFIEPGKQTRGAVRRDSGPPTLSFFLSPIFCPLSSFPRPISLFMLSSLPSSPHLTSHFIFYLFFSLPPLLSLLSALYHPFCHCSNFLPSRQACDCCPLPLSLPLILSLSLLLLSLFDTVNKQVEVAVVVDAAAEVPGNE